MTLTFHIGLGCFHSPVTPWSCSHHPFWGNATSPSVSVVICSRDSESSTCSAHHIHPLIIHFMIAILHITSQFSSPNIISSFPCHWCGNHYGPPVTDHFLSTSTHYPRSWSRNTPLSTLKLACLNGKFLTPGDRFSSLAFDREIPCGVRRQVIYSHPVDCTVVPWGSSSLSVIPLVLVNGFHYWPVIKRCLSMFDASSLSHGSTCTSSEDQKRLKTPDLVSSIRAAIYIQENKNIKFTVLRYR